MLIVNRRFLPSPDELIGTSGTILCSLVVVIIDVVVDGSYIFSAFVCPIWFLVSVVRTVVRRPSIRVAAARILIPIVTMLLVLANYFVQTTVAKANAARLIQACEHYREANGVYPERLSDLVPRYLNSLPRAKYCLVDTEFVYRSSPRPSLFWRSCPPFGRTVYIFDTGEWRYVG
jgi:hypothetical protein